MPLMLAVPDMAFARLNNFSFWMLVMSIIMLIGSLYVERGCGTG